MRAQKQSLKSTPASKGGILIDQVSVVRNRASADLIKNYKYAIIQNQLDEAIAILSQIDSDLSDYVATSISQLSAISAMGDRIDRINRENAEALDRLING